jgi:hypothetical protein
MLDKLSMMCAGFVSGKHMMATAMFSLVIATLRAVS